MSTLIGVLLLVALIWYAVGAFAAREYLIAAIAVLYELLRGRHN